MNRYSHQKKHHFNPDHSLFLGDLSYFCSEQDLMQLFQPYGPIIAVNVCRGYNDDPLMYGFIELTGEMIKNIAMQDLDGIEFMGRRLR
jgi:RNA recognition motif-containing protein